VWPILLIAPPPVQSSPPISLAQDLVRAIARYEAILDRALQKSRGPSISAFRHAFSPIPVAHYGLLCLARALHEKGLQSRFFYGSSENELRDRVSAAMKACPGPILVGISSLTPNWPSVVRLAGYIKSLNAGAKVVVGGPHPSFRAEKCIAEPVVDGVVQFGGESTFLELALWFSKGCVIEELEIPGLVHRGTKPPYSNRGPAGRCQNPLPEEWQTPLYSLLTGEDLRRIASFVVCSRGCPRRCSFCIEGRYWPRSLPRKSVSSVVAELQFLAGEAGQPFVHIADSTFLSDSNYAASVLRTVEADNSLPALSVNVHLADLDDPNSFGLLASEAVIEVLVGLETLSDEGQVSIGRRLSFDDIRDLLSRLRRKARVISAYTMLGLPGEDDSSMDTSANRISSLLQDGLIDCTIPKFFVPYPGTTFFQRPKDFHIAIDEDNLEGFERWHVPRPLCGNVPSTASILSAMRSILTCQSRIL
jgi:radical SAM superfamily enzyme YgiQ (UPF0313 family)